MIEPFGYTNDLQCFSATIIIRNKNSLIGANSYYFAMNKSRKMAFFTMMTFSGVFIADVQDPLGVIVLYYPQCLQHLNNPTDKSG